MDKTKILFVTQSIDPFMEGHSFAALVRKIAQGTQESDREIRVFMPRFGVINERRHQLHEVIRLSGMNLIINDSDHPLIIKVASIPQARMQVYFIDNDEFFKRKSVFTDKKDSKNFSEDNAERALFFSRGVLETVKKLGWTPDIVHCQGWMTGFTPLYLRKMYAQDPHFADVKVVYTAFDTEAGEKLAGNVVEKLAFDGIKEEEVTSIKEGSVLNMHKIAMDYSDGIICGDETLNEELSSYIKELDKPTLDFQDESAVVEAHQSFYDKVLELDEVMAD